ncbi:MAG: HD domain-containing protein [Dehalococcoidia bacterium]|nr:HD domain-containing protein [Dehalococcoidia bacterium]
MHAAASRGRQRPHDLNEEDEHAWLSPFQIDRERIVRCKTFRRLMHKAQVFLAPQGDHYLTRLTHTMEVSLIARAVCRDLALNEDLAEAICMGHDLGHSPFGHLGERTLAEMHPGGFRHNRQSVRVVEELENDGRGLNLSWEVRQGILRHSKGRMGIEGKATPPLDTLESQAAKMADALAYVIHDTDDAIRAGVIGESDLPHPVTDVLGTERRHWSRRLVDDIVAHSWQPSWEEPQPEGASPQLQMSPSISLAANSLREFLFQRVYDPASAGEQADRAQQIVRLLYTWFRDHPQRIPAGGALPGDPPERMALDYVSGMTDGYALRVAESITPGVTQGFLQQGVPVSLPRI